MQRTDCTRDEQISEYLDGHLDGETMRILSLHIKECASCSDEYLRLAALQKMLRNLQTPSMPNRAQFWADAHRTARLDVAKTRVPVDGPIKTWLMQQNGFARSLTGLAAVLLGLIVLVPIARHEAVQSTKTATVSVQAVTTMDVAPLMSAHVSYAAEQPLADDSQLSMILSEQSAPPDPVAGESSASSQVSEPDAAWNGDHK